MVALLFIDGFKRDIQSIGLIGPFPELFVQLFCKLLVFRFSNQVIQFVRAFLQIIFKKTMLVQKHSTLQITGLNVLNIIRKIISEKSDYVGSSGRIPLCIDDSK
jgi:hypothetical protein